MRVTLWFQQDLCRVEGRSRYLEAVSACFGFSRTFVGLKAVLLVRLDSLPDEFQQDLCRVEGSRAFAGLEVERLVSAGPL